MRISDWSSDVCSSDLGTNCHGPGLGRNGTLRMGREPSRQAAAQPPAAPLVNHGAYPIESQVMSKLHHLPLSPYCRKIRVVLHEKGIDAEFESEPVWERREAFLELNSAGTVPVFIDADGTVVCDSTAICEYLEEKQPDPPLIGKTPAERAETRRLVAWFDGKDRKSTRLNSSHYCAPRMQSSA